MSLVFPIFSGVCVFIFLFQTKRYRYLRKAKKRNARWLCSWYMCIQWKIEEYPSTTISYIFSNHTCVYSGKTKKKTKKSSFFSKNIKEKSTSFWIKNIEGELYIDGKRAIFDIKKRELDSEENTEFFLEPGTTIIIFGYIDSSKITQPTLKSWKYPLYITDKTQKEFLKSMLGWKWISLVFSFIWIGYELLYLSLR